MLDLSRSYFRSPFGRIFSTPHASRWTDPTLFHPRNHHGGLRPDAVEVQLPYSVLARRATKIDIERALNVNPVTGKLVRIVDASDPLFVP